MHAQTLSNQIGNASSSNSQSKATPAANGNQHSGVRTVTIVEINQLVAEVEGAFNEFVAERSLFESADKIHQHLLAAIYLTRADAALVGAQDVSTGVRDRLQKVTSHLAMSEDLMLYRSITASTASSAQANNVRSDTVGSASARSSASFAPVLTRASLGTIQSGSTQNVLTAQTSVYAPGVDGALPYELAGVSVTIGGRAAAVLSVSPSLITFYVPAELMPGEAEVVVTSQDGYVSRGATTIAAIAPGLFAASGDGAGEGTIMNAATYARGTFEVTTSEALEGDKRTRLMMFASGISTAAANWDATNDVRTDGSTVANLAESIVVEARTRDGRVFRLPVEYAGTQGRLTGLDQINFVLIPELQGAGNVELTLIAGNYQSNNVGITVR
ncbi:MAG: hypothetical protein H0T92_17445 [Pyrinomonadaceae bacterium]|nr:hypothetical protein [Pyrinomonadaceae bacterium]